MKTLKLCGLIIMAVLMSASFSACGSDNDDDNENNVGVPVSGKKLVEMTLSDDGSFEKHVFSYGKDGKLAEIKQTFRSSDIEEVYEEQFSWMGSEIKEVDNEGYLALYKLKNNHIASKTETEMGESYVSNYDYDEKGRLLSILNVSNNKSTNLFWDGDKLTKIVRYDKEVTLEYSNNQTCKGFLPVLELLIGRGYIELLYPSLYGINRTYLPNKMVKKYNHYNEEIFTFTYKLSSDGYVEKCEVTREDSDDNMKATYTYKWE